MSGVISNSSRGRDINARWALAASRVKRTAVTVGGWALLRRDSPAKSSVRARFPGQYARTALMTKGPSSVLQRGPAMTAVAEGLAAPADVLRAGWHKGGLRRGRRAWHTNLDFASLTHKSFCHLAFSIGKWVHVTFGFFPNTRVSGKTRNRTSCVANRFKI